MKNKRGFTLIELLAVIVILSILILLAMPSVVGLMNKAKYNAFKLETESILKIAEVAYAEDPTDATMINSENPNNTYICYSLKYFTDNGYTNKTFTDDSGAILINKVDDVTHYYIVYKTDDYSWVVDLTPGNPDESPINLESEEFTYDEANVVYGTLISLMEENELDMCTVMMNF